MRPLKILGILVAALAGLLMIGGVVIVLAVDPNAYRGDLERMVEQKTGRRLAIGGKLDLKLFPHLAISMTELQLGNRPGYGQSAFVSVRKASVGVRLLPILHKRLEVSRIVLDGLTANLLSRSASDNNWEDLTSSKNNTSPAGGNGGTSQASIAAIEVTNAALLYRDATRQSVTELSNLSLHAGTLNGRGPVDVDLAFDYGNGGPGPVAHVSIATLVQWLNDSPQVALRDLDIRGVWFGSDASHARGLSFSVRSPSVELDPRAQTLSPASLTAQVGDVTGKLSVTAERLFTDRVVTGTLTVPPVAARKALESLDIRPPATRDPNALSAFSLSCNYRLTRKQLQLTNLEVTLDDTRVRGSAAVEDFDTLALRYALNADRIDADRYLPPAAKGQAADGAAKDPGPGATKLATALPVETLRKLDVQGSLEVGQGTIERLVFTGVSLPLAAKSGRIHAGPAHASLLGGDYNGDIVLDAANASSGPARLSLNEHVKGADVGTLMKTAFDTARLSGHGDADVVVAGAGNTYDDILRSLSGEIELNVKEGALNGVDLSYEVQRVQALLQQWPAPARSGSARTLFNTFSGSANLDKGVLRNDDLSIETDYLETHGKGTLDLGTKAIDYRLLTSIYKVPSGPASAGKETRGTASNGKVADIPLRLTGNLGNLKIRPDLEALAAAKIRQEVNDRLQGKKDGLKQLGDKLKDLLGR
jgi:AsmA protein